MLHMCIASLYNTEKFGMAKIWKFGKFTYFTKLSSSKAKCCQIIADILD